MGPGVTWVPPEPRSNGQPDQEEKAPGLFLLGTFCYVQSMLSKFAIATSLTCLSSALLTAALWKETSACFLKVLFFCFFKLNLGEKALAYSELNPSSLLQINSSNSVVIHWKAFNTKAPQISATSVSLSGH